MTDWQWFTPHLVTAWWEEQSWFACLNFVAGWTDECHWAPPPILSILASSWLTIQKLLDRLVLTGVLRRSAGSWCSKCPFSSWRWTWNLSSSPRNKLRSARSSGWPAFDKSWGPYLCLQNSLLLFASACWRAGTSRILRTAWCPSRCRRHELLASGWQDRRRRRFWFCREAWIWAHFWPNWSKFAWVSTSLHTIDSSLAPRAWITH